MKNRGDDMNKNTIFRLKGYEKFTGNVIYTEWQTLDVSLHAVSSFFEWFEKITYDQSIEYKTLFQKGGEE